MPGHVFLEGDRLSLRTITPDDFDYMARHLNDPEVRHGGLEKSRTPFYSEGIEAQFEQVVHEDTDAHPFLACQGETPVGSAFLNDVDLEGRKAELGYWIEPDEQGNGYATEAAELVLTHAFDQLGLHKVWARTAHDNEASKRVLEKLGFEHEGTLREQWLGLDRYVDEDRFGLLESER